MASRVTPATNALTRAGVAYRLLEYDPAEADPHAPGYAVTVARLVGVPAHTLAKTLIVALDDGGHGRLAVAIVAGTEALDVKAAAGALGAKSAILAQPADAERATGYVVGGISPFGQRRSLPTVVDTLLVDLERVVVSAGRRGLQVEVNSADLIRVTRAVTAAIRRR